MFADIVVAGIPLLAIVIGLVQFVKGFGLNGNAVQVASLVIGLVLGIGYQVSLAPPADFAGWFATVIFGLGLGLVASGLYDANKVARG
jgi:hypothetical protein